MLSDPEEIVRMITGTDYIGILPDNVVPRYCANLFPHEDRIIDFMNPAPPDMSSRGNRQGICNSVLKNLNKWRCKNMKADGAHLF